MLSYISLLNYERMEFVPLDLAEHVTLAGLCTDQASEAHELADHGTRDGAAAASMLAYSAIDPAECCTERGRGGARWQAATHPVYQLADT